MKESVSNFIGKLVLWGLFLGIGALYIYELNGVRESTDALLEGGVVTVGRITKYDLGSADDGPSVKYAYYYRGKLYKREYKAPRRYDKGDYVYVMLVPEKPHKGYHIFHRKVDPADTILNVVIDDVKLSELEIRDMMRGRVRLYDNVKH